MIWRRGWRLILMILISIQILIYNHLGIQEGDPPKTSLLSRDFLAVESPAANPETDFTDYHVNQLRCAGIPQELINSSSIHSWRAELREAIAIPKLGWLPNYRNPCQSLGVEKATDTQNAVISCGNKTISASQEPIACLPHVYIAGMPKCGTTDLYDCLRRHRHVFAALHKEPEWWTRKVAGVGESHLIRSWKWYLSLYANSSQCVRDITEKHSFHPSVIVDASSSTFWELNRWPLYPGNDDVMAPVVTTAQLIGNFTPHARIIALFRNPTDRLLSHYYHRCFVEEREGCNSNLFHTEVLRALGDFQRCTMRRTNRECIYDSCLHVLGLDMRKVSIRGGLYVHFVEEWLKIFPRKQLHFIHYESYIKNRTEELKKTVSFIGIDAFSDRALSAIAGKAPSNARAHEQMLSTTRTLLDKFYAPFNKALSRLLKDNRFSWES